MVECPTVTVRVGWHLGSSDKLPVPILHGRASSLPRDGEVAEALARAGEDKRGGGISSIDWQGRNW